MNGIGVDEDEQEAFNWFKKSALQGDCDSAYMVGVCYEEGMGVEEDCDEAREWYERAVEYGSKEAKKALKKLK